MKIIVAITLIIIALGLWFLVQTNREPEPVVPPSDQVTTTPETLPNNQLATDTPEVVPANPVLTDSKKTMETTSNKKTTTASGLQYEILKKGTGAARPTLKNVVKVHYHGTLLNGTVFDSSIDRGEPIEFPLGNVIKGWQEGLQLMSVGDTFKFTIPADLAYGDNPPPQIPAGATLVFTVELLGIK
jgi:FKBP-type peptidyl-prolyl cis-trans isomerase